MNGAIPENFVGEKDWFLLYWIAYYKYLYKKPITTAFLKESLPLSQQTISRRSIDLERKGFIRRYTEGRSNALELTAKGYLQLQRIFHTLKKIFRYESYSTVFAGKLRSGFGEGAYYIQKKGYLDQFCEKLGFMPYFGTLNLEIPEDLYELFIEEQSQRNVPAIKIHGFREKDRAFGAVECYMVELWVPLKPEDKVPGALLRIHRTAHKENILEFIAPYYLRDYFNIDEGDMVFFKFKEIGSTSDSPEKTAALMNKDNACGEVNDA